MAARLGEIVAPGRATWSPFHELLPYDFRYGKPAYGDLPLEAWTRLLGRRARKLSVRRLAHQLPGGAPQPREALAGYLRRARGVVCDASQIVIVHGSQQAIDLSTRLSLNPGDAAAVVEPHYTGFSICLRAAGARLADVPVDEQGMQGERLAGVAARLACVTPSLQCPTGAVLSLQRRVALLEWAQHQAAYVLEDDYDGEFRFDASPIERLQALDRDGRVVYAGTASKLLFPALRIGGMVAPPALVPHVVNAKALADTGAPSLEQLALAACVAEGHLERHARRARTRTAARRGTLLDAVGHARGDRARVRGASAGLHVLLELPGVAAHAACALREACGRRGGGGYPAARVYARPPAHAELLLGYAAPDQDAIRDGVAGVAEAVDRLETW
jgi:GntR family transcriptional regulator/MocR family aminotransferase